MPDPTEINDTDLETLAREFGKPVPKHLKQDVLDEIARKRAKQREEDLLRDFETDSDESPELEQ